MSLSPVTRRIVFPAGAKRRAGIQATCQAAPWIPDRKARKGEPRGGSRSPSVRDDMGSVAIRSIFIPL